MTTYPKTKAVLNEWKNYVILGSRSRLRRSGVYKGSNLQKSIKGRINQKLFRDDRGRFTGGGERPMLTFQFNAYGEFLDQGVTGRDSSIDGHVKNGAYKYKKSKKRIPVSAVKKWAKQRGLNPWAVSMNIHRRGIKRSLFFSRPFELSMERFSDRFAEALQQDEINNIQNNL
jgi:hypothetical protein